MPLVVACPDCAKKYRLKDELRGKKFKCKQCGTAVLIEAVSEPTSAPEKRRKKKKGAAPDKSADPFGDVAQQEQKSAHKKVRESEDVHDDYGPDNLFGGSYDDHAAGNPCHAELPKPLKKKKKRKKKPNDKQQESATAANGGLPPMTFSPNRLNVGAVVLGGFLIFMGGQELRLALKAANEPREITLSELEADGPGDDVYFTVSGVMPVTDEYVAEEDRLKNMSKVWIPCASQEAAEDSKFLLYTTNAKTEDDVFTLMISGTHTGMIINDITGLGSEEKKLLRSSGLSPDDAYIFEVGRKPSGYLKCASMLIGGLLIIGVGLGWMLFVHE